MNREEVYKKVLEDWSTPEKCSQDESWRKLEAKIEAKGKGKVISLKVMSWAAAAAVLVFAFTFLFPSEEMVNLSTLGVDHSESVLPDGSKVWLNAGSSLAYDAADWDESREVELNGEAYFEVKSGSKFTVKTNYGQVEVLGTKFNVFSRQDFEVSCVEGKVAVNCHGEEAVLTQGMHVEMDDDLVGLAEVTQMDTWADWREQTHYYSEESLERVFKEIEIQFGVELEYPEIGDRVYSGPLETKDLNQSLEMVCLPMGMRYEIDENMGVRILRLEE